MNDQKSMTDEADIGSGEQEIANKEELLEEIRKIPSDKLDPAGEPDDNDASPTLDKMPSGGT